MAEKTENKLPPIVYQGILSDTSEPYMKPGDEPDKPTGVMRNIIRFRAEWPGGTAPGSDEMATRMAEGIKGAVMDTLHKIDEMKAQGTTTDQSADIKKRTVEAILKDINSPEFEKRMRDLTIPADAIVPIREALIAQITDLRTEMETAAAPSSTVSTSDSASWTAKVAASRASAAKAPNK